MATVKRRSTKKTDEVVAMVEDQNKPIETNKKYLVASDADFLKELQEVLKSND